MAKNTNNKELKHRLLNELREAREEIKIDASTPATPEPCSRSPPAAELPQHPGSIHRLHRRYRPRVADVSRQTDAPFATRSGFVRRSEAAHPVDTRRCRRDGKIHHAAAHQIGSHALCDGLSLQKRRQKRAREFTDLNPSRSPLLKLSDNEKADTSRRHDGIEGAESKGIDQSSTTIRLITRRAPSIT